MDQNQTNEKSSAPTDISAPAADDSNIADVIAWVTPLLDNTRFGYDLSDEEKVTCRQETNRQRRHHLRYMSRMLDGPVCMLNPGKAPVDYAKGTTVAFTDDYVPIVYIREARKEDSSLQVCHSGGMTLVTMENATHIAIFMSTCAMNDRYCKKEGIKVALENDPVAVIPLSVWEACPAPSHERIMEYLRHFPKKAMRQLQANRVKHTSEPKAAKELKTPEQRQAEREERAAKWREKNATVPV
jgi:hypothetical protein